MSTIETGLDLYEKIYLKFNAQEVLKVAKKLKIEDLPLLSKKQQVEKIIELGKNKPETEVIKEFRFLARN